MSSTRQDVNVGLIAFIGVVGSMVLLILVLGVQAWFGYESDLVIQQRYDADDNVDWKRLKAEQYANIGDTAGNDTIYADEIENPSRYIVDMGGNRTQRFDYLLGEGELAGYRFTGERRDRLVVPIHEAMAAVVRERGGREVTAQAMREVDERYYVTLANEAYRDPDSYVEADGDVRGGGVPTTRPAGGEAGQSAARRNGSETPAGLGS